MRRLIELLAGTRERLRGLFFRSRSDADLSEELRFHIDMEAGRLTRAGVDSEEARRRAAASFGGVERYKDEVREARGLSWIPGTRLDFVLGFRMMKKNPALSIVGGLGMAVGVALSVGMFVFIRTNMFADIPLDEGDRIVSIEYRDIRTNDEERHLLQDFNAWRGELTSLTELGAYRTVIRNVTVEHGSPEPMEIAEITATGFTVPRVAPLQGRYLTLADEQVGAPPVIVIGEEIWKTRFGGRSDVIGRALQLAGVNYTIVGVMPESFRFPFSHRLWIPLRADPLAFEHHRGPTLLIFGRLADGATMSSAQAELNTMGARRAAAFSEDSRLMPFVMPYARTETDDMTPWEVVGIQAMMTLLLIVISLNVAMLVYARTATRHAEITVRSALGASRRRIVTQLFIEALVLSLCSAAAGLVLAITAIRFASTVLDDDMRAAFWINYRVQPVTVLYTMGIAVLAAIIVGAIPALQATGKTLQNNLRQLGGSALRLGRVWTTLIVAQVALAVAVLPAAVSFAWTQARGALTHYAYDASEFASAALQIDATDEGGRAVTPTRPFGDELSEMVRRIESEPSISGVTYESALPGRFGRVETEGVDVAGAVQPQIYSNGIAQNYFDVHGIRVLAGRSLSAEDLDSASASVVVNRAFVDRVLAGAPALGRRVRYAARPATSESPEVPASKWFRIVGVVANARTNEMAPEVISPELYYGIAPSMAGTGAPVVITMRMRASTAAAIAPRVREIAARVNPGFRFGQITTQSKLDEQTQTSIRLIASALGIVLIVVFLLSAAGVYALVSFTVTRRRKEIGIRAALGASQRQVLAGVLGPVARQIALGVLIGLGGAAALDRVGNAGLFTGATSVLLPVFGVLMSIVALLAALGPARRGLRTQPTEALRES